MPEAQEAGTCSLLDSDVAPHWPAKPGVYVRGAFTRQMGQQQLARMTGGTRCVSGAAQLACESLEPSLHAAILVLEGICAFARYFDRACVNSPGAPSCLDCISFALKRQSWKGNIHDF